MNDRPCKENELSRLAGMIRDLPEEESPASLLPSVMAMVRAQQVPWWHRLTRWAGAPRSITFTPLQMAPMAALLMITLTFSVLYLVRGRHQDPVIGQEKVPIVFSLSLPDAQSVSVIGTFNEWHPQGYEMRLSSNGRKTWTATLMLPEGRYEYGFLVDGQTIVPDPDAGFYQDDGFGNQNAVLFVGNKNEKSI